MSGDIPTFPTGPLREEAQGPDGKKTFTDAFNVSWVEAGPDRWTRAALQPHRPPPKADARAATPADPFPATSADAAAFIAEIRRRYDEKPDACHVNEEPAATALARADANRRADRFAEAFDWYMAAFEADRRNIRALRGREDMRLPAYRRCLEPPTAPANLQFSVDGSTVTLRWLPSAGHVSTYVVEAGSASGLADLATLTSSDTMLTIKDVASRTYHARVSGRNACGVSAASNEVIVPVR